MSPSEIEYSEIADWIDSNWGKGTEVGKAVKIADEEAANMSQNIGEIALKLIEADGIGRHRDGRGIVVALAEKIADRIAEAIVEEKRASTRDEETEELQAEYYADQLASHLRRAV